ncbi:polysaccharide biosynthesis protein [Virgibacillus pantothenticus]|uniref:lipopolysaccharide biosynthesis protein n=1 Tax=Virgibacillus TaxID=84406 RepID=UPI000909C470|nr:MULTISPECIES: oligosaccharide flippase family protein [Virgibacillus]API92974.1 hypothetical protein BKP57_14855 [Virgibacillus sp. 6R]MBS7428500.1 oligosaccharide flippase family protein [Virgibacillus sp. 19R1-5]GIP62943.1 polysaccharide biosynthesis protein [Virgibacillus pantothenticus]
MKKKIKNIFSSEFVRSVLIMASGAAGAQAVAMALSPIITRLYGPEAYGIMGTFISMVNIIAPVAALTYPIAIVLPRNDLDAKGIIRLSLIITSGISILSFFVITIFKQHIITLFNLKEISSFLYLIPLVIIFGGIMQVSEQWLIRTKQFNINARVTFWQSVIINSSKAGLGLIYPFSWVLVMFTALANGLKAAMMIFYIKKSTYKKVYSKEQNRKSIKDLAKEYYDFPAYRAPEVFLNAISNGLPILMLTGLFGTAAAGFYSIGRTVLSLPSLLIGNAVGDVFYPRIAEAEKNGENITILIKKATISLGLIGLVPFGLIILFGPVLFSFVFGSGWDTAGEYARWIALWSLFAFINKPSIKALPVLHAQRFQLFYTIFMLIMRIVALVVGYLFFSSDIISVALFGVTGAILNIVLVMITIRISKKHK